MGTSISSSGPGGNVPFDPPWLNEDDVPDTNQPPEEDENKPQQDEDDQSNGDGNKPQDEDGQSNKDKNKPQDKDDQSHGNEDQLNHQTEVSLPTNLAPPRRFLSANRNFKQFMRNGSQKSFGKALGKALGGYSGKGMGGSSRIVRRMQRSANMGADIYSSFQNIRTRRSDDVKTNDLIHYLSSEQRSTEDIKNAFIRHLLPDGGSLDEESCRNSLYQAMSDLLKRPNIDLARLEDVDIWFLIEKFMVYEVVHRIVIDLGRITESKKYSPIVVVQRRKEMTDYIQAVMSVEFTKIKSNNHRSNITSVEMKKFLNSVLKETFDVFEENL
jgi:hypothetical protein